MQIVLVDMEGSTVLIAWVVSYRKVHRVVWRKDLNLLGSEGIHTGTGLEVTTEYEVA